MVNYRNMFSLWSLLNLICVLCITSGSNKHEHNQFNTDVYLNAQQIIRKYGFTSETHTIVTVDGYLITMHHIPKSVSSKKKIPVFLVPGALCTSEIYLLMGRNSLPFLLSDAGYDVWLANMRGNSFSRANVNLFPDQKKFWNFSWHESGIYDLPAQIDYICSHTKQDKVNFIGYSMGTTMYLVLTSTRPEYNKKIKAAFLISTVGYLKYSRSHFARFLSRFAKHARVLDNFLANGEFLPGDKNFKHFLKVLCLKFSFETSICWKAMSMIIGYDPIVSRKPELALLIGHYPNGYSYKGLEHYTQLIKSGKFRQFDYGKKGNLLQYGTPTPPDYNLAAITTPMYFYESKGDYLSTLEDIKLLTEQLPTTKEVHVVNYKYFNHIDFMLSYTAREWVYDVLLRDLSSYASN